MSVIGWVFAIWASVLAYTVVGALVWRVTQGRYYCLFCEEYHDGLEASVLWPFALALLIGWKTIRVLIYIPFRGVARAIAKPGDES